MLPYGMELHLCVLSTTTQSLRSLLGYIWSTSCTLDDPVKPVKLNPIGKDRDNFTNLALVLILVYVEEIILREL